MPRPKGTASSSDDGGSTPGSSCETAHCRSAVLASVLTSGGMTAHRPICHVGAPPAWPGLILLESRLSVAVPERRADAAMPRRACRA